MKKLILLLLCTTLLCGCTAMLPAQKQYTATFLNYFDTVTKIVGKAESKEAFESLVTPIRDELEYYHKLFDIYEEYDGINNLKTVNDKASTAPVKVDTAIIDLLEDSLNYYNSTFGKFNPAMGSVLKLWHDAREYGINNPTNAYLPDKAMLENASLHMSPENIIIDRENSTVFISDPKLQIDVGALAKGWAVERICESASEGLLISVGGNVCATGPKDESGTPWAVGIESPDLSGNNLHVLDITDGSVVTSGSYHRAYAVNGKLYHHIIDPETLYPSELWTSVTVVCPNSGLADVLSTSLFLLDRDDGQKLLDKYGAFAMWLDPLGNEYFSPGFESFIRS